MTVLDKAAELGINAVWSLCYERWVKLWNEYREQGGKLKNWIAQPDRIPMEKELRIAVKNGATAICIQGIRVDDQVKQGKWDVVRGWLEFIRSHNLPAGIATHRATTQELLAWRTAAKLPNGRLILALGSGDGHGWYRIDDEPEYEWSGIVNSASSFWGARRFKRRSTSTTPRSPCQERSRAATPTAISARSSATATSMLWSS